MISRIKSAFKVDELIGKLADSLQTQQEEIKTLAESIKGLKQEFSELAQTTQTTLSKQDLALEKFDRIIDHIEQDKDKLHKSIVEFDIQKSNAGQRIVEQLRNDINKFKDMLRTDVSAYDKLKTDINLVARDIDRTRAEISKFHEISKTIKSSDFEMTKYIRNVQEMDREKLALMKKIDGLERMIAKERRRN